MVRCVVINCPAISPGVIHLDAFWVRDGQSLLLANDGTPIVGAQWFAHVYLFRVVRTGDDAQLWFLSEHAPRETGEMTMTDNTLCLRAGGNDADGLEDRMLKAAGLPAKRFDGSGAP